MTCVLSFYKQNQQSDSLIYDKQEHSPQSMKTGWRKKLNFFAFLFLKLNKTSILFTFLLKFVFNFSYRKSEQRNFLQKQKKRVDLLCHLTNFFR